MSISAGAPHSIQELVISPTSSHVPATPQREELSPSLSPTALKTSKPCRRIDKTLILEIQSELGRGEKSELEVRWPTTAHAARMNRTRAQLKEMWDKVNRQVNAAVTIQKNVRGHLVRHLLVQALSNNLIKEANEKAVLIQKSWRMNLAMSKARELALSQIVATDCSKAESAIGSFMRMASARMNTKYYALCTRLWPEILKATVKLQAFARMVGIRGKYTKILVYESLCNSVKWRGKGRKVQVVGTFTQPQWKVKLELDHCEFRGIFVKYLDNLEAGRVYEYSFSVDGKERGEVFSFIAEDKSDLAAFSTDVQDSPKRESLGTATNDESPRLSEARRERLAIGCPTKDPKEWKTRNLGSDRKEYGSSQCDEILTQTTDRDVYDSGRVKEKISSHETLCCSTHDMH
eukprot:TRINITY_DN12662_c0_g1_i3.p1 TRINITY_DN12662_c0_g1~~TRINITY_DN12662_c0_g1_i3.p1  ORF type:complete len:405 (+),score=77.44 TRINITY_DN12662_c0_g1_i3:225-1439(+)